MSVLSRDALQDSPLADLHEIASALGIDGFRRLRKDDLVDTIIERQGGDAGGSSDEPSEDRPARSRSRRGGRSRAKKPESSDDDAPAGDDEKGDDEQDAPPAREPRSRSRSRRSAASDDDEAPSRSRGGRSADNGADKEDQVVEGSVEILANGSGFIRVGEGESDGDVYISAAQVRRCDLVNGDRVGGPVRRPRRSERYASLVRVETINGSPAEEVSAGTPYDELPATFPSTPIAFTAKDPVLKQIADLAPIGRGSRVSIVGASGSGRTTTLRALAVELAAQEGVEVHVVLAGARPEELPEWVAAELTPEGVATLAAGPDAQAQAVDRVVDTAKRNVARGGHAAVVIDALDQLPPGLARRALAAARSVPDGGTLTIVAAGREPVGGETTVIALVDGGAEKHPVLDAAASHTLRTEALVGSRKATAILKARAKALAPAAPAAE
jgi:transcription termination factor Rho